MHSSVRLRHVWPFNCFHSSFCGDFTLLCECLFFAACVQVCVARSRPLKGISDVPLLQIRAVHGVPGGSHADRGADLNGLEKRGWEKMETGMGGGWFCVCVLVGDQTRRDVNRHPSTRELLSRRQREGARMRRRKGGREGGRHISREGIGETRET